MKNCRGGKIRVLCRCLVFWHATRAMRAVPMITNLYLVCWECVHVRMPSFCKRPRFYLPYNFSFHIQGESTQTVQLWWKILSTKKLLGFYFILDLLSLWVEVLLTKKSRQNFHFSEKKISWFQLFVYNFSKKKLIVIVFTIILRMT